MKAIDILNSIGNVDDRFIKETDMLRRRQVRVRVGCDFRPLITIVASFIVVCTAAIIILSKADILRFNPGGDETEPTITEATTTEETTEETTTEIDSELKPNIEGDLSEEEITALIDYANRLSNKIYFEFPLFDDINEVSLLTLLLFNGNTSPEPDFEYTNQQFNELFENEVIATDIKGYSPETIDKYLKENLNPDFSIESYDYENYDLDSIVEYKWDDERELMVFYTPPHGPQVYITLGITDIQKSGDDYYVYASSFRGSWNDIEYSYSNLKYHFIKNGNGLFNIYSIEQNGDEKPECLNAADTYFASYEGNELDKYDKLAFYDINDDGIKDAVLRFTDDNQEMPEYDSAVIYLDSGEIEFGISDKADLTKLVYYDINSYSYTAEIYAAFIEHYNEKIEFYPSSIS